MLHDIWVLKPILELNVYVLAQVRYYVLGTLCTSGEINLLAEAVKSTIHIALVNYLIQWANSLNSDLRVRGFP